MTFFYFLNVFVVENVVKWNVIWFKFGVFSWSSCLLGFLLFYLEYTIFILEQQLPLPTLLFIKNNGGVNEFWIEYWLFFNSGW